MIVDSPDAAGKPAMDNFKTAGELCIREPEREALIDVMHGLGNGEYVHVPADSLDIGEARILCVLGKNGARPFNMVSFHSHIRDGCGTAGCIGGWMEMHPAIRRDFRVARANGYIARYSTALTNLFCTDGDCALGGITPAQTARACRSFLATGRADWKNTAKDAT